MLTRIIGLSLLSLTILLTSAFGQEKPSPFDAGHRAAPQESNDAITGSRNVTTLSRDPFPEDLAAIQQAELEWRTAQNKLEDIGSSCKPGGSQVIDRAKVTKLKSVGCYAIYYQKSLEYWAKIRDLSGEAELSSRSEFAEILGHVRTLERELTMVVRRKSELDRSLTDNHVDSDSGALRDLGRIEANKREEVAKAQAAVEQSKIGQGFVIKRREYAKERMSEANELLQSLRSETYLYQQLYNAILNRYSLACDQDVPRPVSFPSDWRGDLKKLGPGGGGQK